MTSVILYEEEDAVRTLGTTGRVGGWEGGRVGGGEEVTRGVCMKSSSKKVRLVLQNQSYHYIMMM